MTGNDEERKARLRLVRLHTGVIQYLLIAFPVVGVFLLGASHVWDLQQGEDCKVSESMLDFFSVAVRWYFGAVVAAIVVFPRVFAILFPNPPR